MKVRSSIAPPFFITRSPAELGKATLRERGQTLLVEAQPREV